MNIIHLRYALAVEETGSVTRAAEQLFVAQPNISRALRELEASVGTVLFQRTALGMIATEEGREFLKRARSIVHEIDLLKGLYDGGTGQAFFSVASHGGRYVADAFASFLSETGAGAGAYTLSEVGSAAVISGVSQGLYTLGVLRYLQTETAAVKKQLAMHGLSPEPLFSAPLYYTMSARSPLAALPSVRASDAEKLAEVTGEAVFYAGVAPRAKSRIRIFDRESRIKALCTAENTYMLETAESPEFLQENGLVQRPAATQPAAVQDAILMKEKHVRTRTERAFLEKLVQKAKIYKN